MTSAAQLTPLDIDAWDPDLADIVADMKGRPLNVHRLMANHPQLLKAWWNFRNYSVQGGALGRRRGELVILRVALHMRAWYEWGSHVERAQACGLSLTEIERVKQDLKIGEWAPAEALLLAAVDELIETRGLSPRSLSALAEHYSPQEIMDIMAIHGMYIILGCMINTWGLELEESVAAKLPEGVTQEAFEAEFPRESRQPRGAGA
ncbi:MAG: carboxymuconolactone decarboxylase family protein [Kiloniellales bacterium]